jgi:hypothetical protein
VLIRGHHAGTYSAKTLPEPIRGHHAAWCPRISLLLDASYSFAKFWFFCRLADMGITKTSNFVLFWRFFPPASAYRIVIIRGQTFAFNYNTNIANVLQQIMRDY